MSKEFDIEYRLEGRYDEWFTGRTIISGFDDISGITYLEKEDVPFITHLHLRNPSCHSVGLEPFFATNMVNLEEITVSGQIEDLHLDRTFAETLRIYKCVRNVWMTDCNIKEIELSDKVKSIVSQLCPIEQLHIHDTEQKPSQLETINLMDNSPLSIELPESVYLVITESNVEISNINEFLNFKYQGLRSITIGRR